MKIQVIGYDSKKILNSELDIDYTTLNMPNSLDEYDINIINLQNEYIWRNYGNTNTSIIQFSDLVSLRIMISNSKKAENIIALPQNYNFKYNYGYRSFNASTKDFLIELQLKDMIFTLTEKILYTLTLYNFNKKLCYENTNTSCAGENFSAAFYFDCELETLSVSNKSEKKTTIVVNDVIYTTLDICNPNTKLENFLSAIKITQEKESYPEWLYEVIFNDDTEQRSVIKCNNEKIDLFQKEIETAEECLEKNMHYKSILFTNGDELVKVVFEILEKILVCDLSSFKDNKNEDFLIKKENVTFIGEIKGVTSNVKSEHVSQVDVHYQSYSDKLQEEGTTETVKQLLVINPFRTKELIQREEVHDKQIALAKRNDCLIITTEVLLFVFEKLLKGEITSEDIMKIFTDNVGILTKEMINS